MNRMTAAGVTAAQRRALLARRHHLAADSKAASPLEVARAVVTLHGTDPASVYLAVYGRMREISVVDIERALYVDRTMIRMLGMRRTMFVVPVEDVPVVQAACTRAIAVQQRRLAVKMFGEAGLPRTGGDVAEWLTDVEESTLRALAARGEALAVELGEDEPRLREQILLARGKAYEASQSIVTRVLFLLAADGHIVRARPRGSWISSQFRWSTVESWLGGPIADLPTDEARVRLARLWLASYGPGTVADLKWWTGWTLGETRKALAGAGAVAVDLDGAPGVWLPEDVPDEAAHDVAVLLPALDPTLMGWADRSWFLGEHGKALFDTNGNAGPTVWWGGRIVGGWAQRPSGEVVFRLLSKIGRAGEKAVATEAARLAEWLGPVRVTPRFRTPLEKELSAV